MDRRRLNQLAREPLYNTRAVAQQTGIPADTFRAWERRYGVPRPHRAADNQRLYSELDIGVISWLRDRTNEGMTISQAIQRLRSEHGDLLADIIPASAEAAPPEPRPQYSRLRDGLVDALVEYDGIAADQLIDETLATLTIQSALAQVIEPVLDEISERWNRNAVSIGVEHFASRTVSRRLMAVFNQVNPVAANGQIVLACAPGGEQETRLLILAVALARRNWRIVYLGQSVPSAVLVDVARQIAPDLVYIHAAATSLASNALHVVREMVVTLPIPPPVAIGGQGIAGMQPNTMPAGAQMVLGTLDDVTDRLIEIIETSRRR